VVVWFIESSHQEHVVKVAMLKVFAMLQAILSMPRHSESTARAWLTLYGALTIAVYAVFCVYLQEHYQAWSRESRNSSNLVLIPGIALLLYVYYQGYRLLRDYPSRIFVPMIVFGILAGIAALLTPSFYSFDLQTYINYGWQQFRYHANPYCLLVAGTQGFGTDPMFTDAWALNPIPYGFAFAHICRLVVEHCEGDIHKAVSIFKATNFSAWLMLAAVVYFGARRLKLPRPDLSLYLYLWSPIVMLHSLSGCHNDILMTLPVMAGLLCATFPQLWVAMLSVPLLVIGSMVKYVWAAAIPFLLMYLVYSQKRAAALLGAVLAVAAIVAISWHYRCDPSTIRWVEFRYNLSTNTNSLSAVVQNVGTMLAMALNHHQITSAGENAVNYACSFVKMTLWGALIGIFGNLLLQCWERRSNLAVSDVVRAGVTMILILTCFVSSKFYPWYIMMFFPAALWLPEKNLVRRIAIAVSCTQVFAVTLLGHGHFTNFVFLTLTPALITWWLTKKSNQTGDTLKSGDNAV
jgi:hypothetical protein